MAGSRRATRLKTPGTSTAPPDTFKIIEMDSPRDGEWGGGGRLKGSKSGGVQYELSDAERAYQEEMKVAEERKRAEEERRAAQEAEAQAAKERHEQLMQDLKGKQFTFDTDGSVIIIHEPNPDKLPPHSYQIGVQVRNPEPKESAGGSRRSRRSTGSSRGGASKGSKNRKKKKKKKGDGDDGSLDGEGSLDDGGSGGDGGSQNQEDSYFQVAPQLQPPLISNMVVSAGVSLVEGDAYKEGPQLESDPMHQSRREFMSTLASWESETMASMTIGEADSPPKTSSFRPEVSMRPMEPGEVAPEDLSPRSQKQRQLAMQEVDPLAGARKVEAPAGGGEGGSDGGGGDDYNVELTTASDWGLCSIGSPPKPARLPFKPNPKQRDNIKQIYGGANVKNPRDRSNPVTTTLTGQKKRMAAPPLGYTTGHGLVPGGSSLWSGRSFELDGDPIHEEGGTTHRSRASKQSGGNFLPPVPGAPNNMSVGSKSAANSPTGKGKARWGSQAPPERVERSDAAKLYFA